MRETVAVPLFQLGWLVDLACAYVIGLLAGGLAGLVVSSLTGETRAIGVAIAATMLMALAWLRSKRRRLASQS